MNTPTIGNVKLTAKQCITFIQFTFCGHTTAGKVESFKSKFVHKSCMWKPQNSGSETNTIEPVTGYQLKSGQWFNIG